MRLFRISLLLLHLLLHNCSAIVQVCDALQNRFKNDIQFIGKSNFTNGPVFLKNPGYYQLTGNIDFNPNGVSQNQDAYNSGDVNWNEKGELDRFAFSLGFFAGIIITGQNILLDLGNFTLQQNPEHALQQRFFSNIELSDRPFIFGKGPHNFGTPMISSQNVCVQNGTLGRSSHSGIHGNNNKNVSIRNLVIQDFEVSGISLNNQTMLSISNVQIPRGREDIPVVGSWSAARNIRPYINKLVEKGYTGQLNIGDRKIDAAMIQQSLKQTINQVFDTIINNNFQTETLVPQPNKIGMFLNPMKLTDSNLYGIVLHGAGPASGGFPQGDQLTESAYSKNIEIRNIKIGSLRASPREIPALQNSDGIHAKDISGAVFQTVNMDYALNQVTINQDKIYIGNVLSNAQLFVAKAIIDGFDFEELTTSRNSIDQSIINWATSNQSLQKMGVKYLCNGDAQFHASQGVMGLRLDSSKNVNINQFFIDKIENQGGLGSNLCKDDYNYHQSDGISNPKGYYRGYTGGIARGYSLAASKSVTLSQCYINQTISFSSSSFGYDVHDFSDDVQMENCTVDRVAASTQQSVKDFVDNPTPIPQAYGFRIFQTGGGSKIYGCNLSLGRKALSSGEDNKGIAAELSDPSCVFVACSIYQTTILTRYKQQLKIDEDEFGDKNIPEIDCPTRSVAKRLTFAQDYLMITFISLAGFIVISLASYYGYKWYKKTSLRRYKQMVRDETSTQVSSLNGGQLEEDNMVQGQRQQKLAQYTNAD